MSLTQNLAQSSGLAGALCSACLCLAVGCSNSDGGSGGASSGDGSSGDANSTGSGGSAAQGTSGGSGGTGGEQTTASTTAGGTGATGTGGSGGSGGDASTDAGGGAAGAGGACPVSVEAHTLETGYHVTECLAIEYSTNPPCTGEHYPVWAAYQTYDFPVPRGYWVHSLEHGAVVITYNCDEGCADEVAEVQGMIDGLTADLRCSGAGIDVQVILTPDPMLDVRWGLSSWGNTLRTDCLDIDAFEDFYYDHVGQAPEDICGGGLVLTEETVTAGCGE